MLRKQAIFCIVCPGNQLENFRTYWLETHERLKTRLTMAKNTLTMPRGAHFQIFEEIIPNSKFAVIIWFWHFLANISQSLALRITLSNIFLKKSYFKLYFIPHCLHVNLIQNKNLTSYYAQLKQSQLMTWLYEETNL